MALRLPSPGIQLSPQQQEIMQVCRTEDCHLIIEALAGTGKTTTILEALKVLPRNQKVAFVCFNKTIATELQGRVPRGVLASTLHSLGGRAISAHTRKSLRDLLGGVRPNLLDECGCLLASLVGDLLGRTRLLDCRISAQTRPGTPRSERQLIEQPAVEAPPGE